MALSVCLDGAPYILKALAFLQTDLLEGLAKQQEMHITINESRKDGSVMHVLNKDTVFLDSCDYTVLLRPNMLDDTVSDEHAVMKGMPSMLCIWGKELPVDEQNPRSS
jgi:hypothetical protein